MPDAYLGGDWRVANRVLNQNDPTSPLANATRVLLEPGKIETQTDGPATYQTGHWAVLRDELMNRPYLRIEMPNEDSRALVTRFRRSENGKHSQLNLYFASGMEMQLERA